MEIISHKIGKGNAVLTGYIQRVSPEMPHSSARPAMLVFPGGAYCMCSDRENEQVAMAYFMRGFQAFVLTYSVGDAARYPVPQQEAFAAIAYIRENAEKFHVDPKRLAVVGFSAGGHLAGSTTVLWNNPDCIGTMAPAVCRPDAAVLVYPCITEGKYANNCIPETLGKDLTDKTAIGLEKHVTAQTPPAFICHTAADTCVPSMNALLFASALAENGVDYELHVYHKGGHGMSLGVCIDDARTLPAEEKAIRKTFSDWFDRSVEFLYSVFGD